MNGRAKIIFSVAIAVLFSLGLLGLPSIDSFVKSCTGTFICGVDINGLLKFLDKSDGTAIDLGLYFYQKIIIGSIVFLITLLLTSMAHRAFQSRLEEEEE